MTELERYQQWCEQAPLDEAGRAALAAMQNDETERKGCFGAELQFGTAGIRGIMGIGTNRLNDFTVRRTAQGLAAWLTSTELPQRCAIGYDSRHNSRRYAELCAVALAERGVHVYVYHELAPTPMLSFAVRQLGCGCGIVVSARTLLEAVVLIHKYCLNTLPHLYLHCCPPISDRHIANHEKLPPRLLFLRH